MWTVEHFAPGGEAAAAAGPLHHHCGPSTYWTTVNAAEAAPGVLSPLACSYWGDASERAVRLAFVELGALPRRLAAPGDIDGRIASVFFGRLAANVTTMRALADAMPGSSGDDLELQFFGALRSGARSTPERRRYPAVAYNLPRLLLTLARRLDRFAEEQRTWWRRTADHGRSVRVDEARRDFAESCERFVAAFHVHSLATMIGQGLYQQLAELARRAGRPGYEVELAAGYGGLEEARLVADLWRVSRGSMQLDMFLADYGFHGPREGELSSRSWREDPAPLDRLLDTYRGMADDAAPQQSYLLRIEERRHREAEFLRTLPTWRRPSARLLLRIAGEFLPMREIGKASFLQAIDVGRWAARAVGAALQRDGLIDRVDDVFYLSKAEVLASSQPAARETVAARREILEFFRSLDLPDSWRGNAQPVSHRPVEDDQVVLRGASGNVGTVEGTAIVVDDPGEVDLEPGDILIAHTTDPSWASIMFVSGAIVTDIGSPLSHGAIVARELGIPCVMGTGNATRTIRTGDQVRVDGAAGTIEILHRSESQTPA